MTRKRIQKKVRIGVGADPPLVSDLEISLGDVGKQRGEFQGPQFELNAGTAPLLLERRANEAGLLIGGAFQDEVETHSPLVPGDTRRVEKLFSARGIIGIVGDIWFGGPMVRR